MRSLGCDEAVLVVVSGDGMACRVAGLDAVDGVGLCGFVVWMR